MPTAGSDRALASPLHSTPAMTSLDEAQLDTVTGGGVVGPVAKVVGKWWGPVDVLTSGYDAYSAYSSARGQQERARIGRGRSEDVRPEPQHVRPLEELLRDRVLSASTPRYSC